MRSIRACAAGEEQGAMTITVGSVWVGTQVHHKWVVRVRKVMPQHVLVEVIAGPSGHRNTLMKFTTSHFLQVYSLRSSPAKGNTG
jgi:hypothetical protein